MEIFRLILPAWAADEFPDRRRVLEGQFTPAQLEELNAQYYNVYYLPNYPSLYTGGTVDGSQIDTFHYVFVDCDLKDGVYASKEDFILALAELPPSRIVDSGGGVHAYWRCSDLDCLSYLRLCRRMVRRFNTDVAVGQVYQLMRHPGYLNTKNPENLRLCELLYEDPSVVYTAEQLDNLLPPLTKEDEQHCLQHYDKTTNAEARRASVSDKMPDKWGHFLRGCQEAKDIWCGRTDDRSKADFRLAHLMFANGFTKEEATSVLVNASKALERAPIHRIGYATNIVDKIWTFELKPETKPQLSMSVADIVQKHAGSLKGTRFRCYRHFDETEHGMRLGDVIGLVGGSGVGKTAVALQMFKGFAENNPDCTHFFIPLEQTDKQIANRWVKLCGKDTHLHHKVHVLPNYNDDGTFRRLSLNEIKEYIINWQKETGKKVGAIVIDHIGVLKHTSKDGRAGIEEICHELKAFAIQTDTVVIIQSQTSREKAGIGDLELNKDAAYGTVYFESYCDYLITIWQPLKRTYEDGAPTVTAFKFCKIREKSPKDTIKEDIRYLLHFDGNTGVMRTMTQVEDKAFIFHNSFATTKRKQDRKNEVLEYKSVDWVTEGGSSNGEVDNSKDAGTAGAATILPH